MRNTALNIILLVALLGSLSSCRHKGFCYDHPHTQTLRLVFDWRDAPQASPEGMCAYFHPLDGEDAPMRRFDFRGLRGGEITLQRGRYHVICYNNDTEAVQISGSSAYATHQAYTRETNLFEPIIGTGGSYSAPAGRDESERVVQCPDMLWGCYQLDIEVTESGITYTPAYPVGVSRASAATVHDADSVVLFPHELICHYSYEIRDVRNLGSVTQMCASLSAMAPSLYFGGERLTAEPVTLPFAATADMADSTIVGQFLTFGHNPASAKANKLVLYVWLNDGSKYYYTWDVSRQVDNAPDPRHVHLIVEGLNLPTPISGAGGLDPSVDDWTEVEDDIYM